MADIEVTMVESYANLKVLSRRWPKQLLKMVMGLQNMRLTTLHLNVTTVDQLVLYSFSLKDGRIDYDEFVAMMQKGNMGIGPIGRRIMRNTFNFAMRDAAGAY